MLTDELDGYAEAKELRSGTAADAYRCIEDATGEMPDSTFPQVVNTVRRDFGMSYGRFLKTYRRARSVYDKAKRWALRDALLRSRIQPRG
jgi:hypothetical protein